ncbi:MAG: DUF6265 family protein [Bacteroidota bacterium]
MRAFKQTFFPETILGFFLLVSIAACNNESGADSADAAGKTDTVAKAAAHLVFDKLAGTWQSEDGKSYERWEKNADGSFRSVAFSVKGTDTSWNEQALIYPENDKWVFENTVRGQNDGKPVKFISSSLTDNSVQFSNPAHDFPTDINYTVPGANTVNAFIIGPNAKGGKDTIPFNYTRVK